MPFSFETFFNIRSKVIFFSNAFQFFSVYTDIWLKKKFYEQKIFFATCRSVYHRIIGLFIARFKRGTLFDCINFIQYGKKKNGKTVTNECRLIILFFNVNVFVECDKISGKLISNVGDAKNTRIHLSRIYNGSVEYNLQM